MKPPIKTSNLDLARFRLLQRVGSEVRSLSNKELDALLDIIRQLKQWRPK